MVSAQSADIKSRKSFIIQFTVMLKTGDIPLRYCTMRKLEEVSPITFISKNANPDFTQSYSAAFFLYVSSTS